MPGRPTDEHMCPFLQLRSNRVTVSVHPHSRTPRRFRLNVPRRTRSPAARFCRFRSRTTPAARCAARRRRHRRRPSPPRSSRRRRSRPTGRQRRRHRHRRCSARWPSTSRRRACAAAAACSFASGAWPKRASAARRCFRRASAPPAPPRSACLPCTDDRPATSSCRGQPLPAAALLLLAPPTAPVAPAAPDTCACPARRCACACGGRPRRRHVLGVVVVSLASMAPSSSSLRYTPRTSHLLKELGVNVLEPRPAMCVISCSITPMTRPNGRKVLHCLLGRSRSWSVMSAVPWPSWKHMPPGPPTLSCRCFTVQP